MPPDTHDLPARAAVASASSAVFQAVTAVATVGQWVVVAACLIGNDLWCLFS